MAATDRPGVETARLGAVAHTFYQMRSSSFPATASFCPVPDRCRAGRRDGGAGGGGCGAEAGDEGPKPAGWSGHATSCAAACQTRTRSPSWAWWARRGFAGHDAPCWGGPGQYTVQGQRGDQSGPVQALIAVSSGKGREVQGLRRAA